MKKFLILILILIQSEALAGVAFDSVDDTLSCGSGTSIDDLSPFTFSAWIFPRSMGESNFGTVAAKTDGGTGWFIEFSGSAGTNQIEYYYENGAVDLIRRSNSNWITLNKWQHLAITGDHGLLSSNYHIYVDGVEVSYLTSQDAVLPLNSEAALSLTIGHYNSGTDDFDGIITEVAYFNRILSQDEIIQMARSRTKRIPINISQNQLRLYLPLDDFQDNFRPTSTSTFFDGSGYKNNCTSTNNPICRAEQILSYP